ncbi:MAG: hypothetical protein IJY89_02840 [Clostridia bacterium]|nr:hypothetical protein [Clostridia bacterium]
MAKVLDFSVKLCYNSDESRLVSILFRHFVKNSTILLHHQIIAREKNEGMMVLLVPPFFGLFHGRVCLPVAFKALSVTLCGEGVSGSCQTTTIQNMYFA